MYSIDHKFSRLRDLTFLLLVGTFVPFAARAEEAKLGKDGLMSPSEILAPGSDSSTKTDSSINLSDPPPPTVYSDSHSAPPPPSAFSNDPAVLVQQAEDAATRASMEQLKREQEHNVKSYDRASTGLLPLSPDQIRDFMHKLENTQQAAQPPFAGQPKAEVKINTLSLDPGVEPPQVNLASGYVTTINMVDATGEPWPILDVGVGGNFEVTPTQSGSHVVRLVPLTRVGSGNLSILLKDLSTPVIFRLSSGGSSMHMRYDARIPKLGPNAKAQLIERGRRAPTAGDEVIMLLLQNNPPRDAKRMKVSGLDTRTMAWSLNGKSYVRTPLQLLSPAWNASASSTDGMTVYEIGEAPVLLMSDNGAMVRAHLLREDENDK